MRRLIALLVVVALTAAACDGDTGGTSTSTTAPASTTAAPSTTSTSDVPTTTQGPSSTSTTTLPATTTSIAGDLTPPLLSVTDPPEGATVASDTYRFRGTTEPGCTVIAAGRYQADVASDGTWSILLALNPGTNVATFTATNAAGNTTELTVSVDFASRLTVGDAVAIAQARLDELWSADPPSNVGAIEISCDDPDRQIDAGDVFTCYGISRIPSIEEPNLAFLVLDDQGTTSMLPGSDLPSLEAAYATTPHGLLCRDLLAGAAQWPFDLSGTTDDVAAFLATAYWFLEGRPDRMDADGDGVPCETVLPAEAISWVWDGGLLTGGYATIAESIPDLLHRIDDLPVVPFGSRLVDFTFYLSRGPGALIETPDGWHVWRGPGGDASWRVEVLPNEVFSETSLRTVAVLGDATYVAGAAGNIPAVWHRGSDAIWTELLVDDESGPWGWVDGIVECDDDVVFTGHHSASNQVLEYKVWRIDENGDLAEVFNRGGGPPGSGTPGPAVYCHDGSFMALVTFGREPGASGDFTYDNEIWSSPTGSDWSLVEADPIDPAIRPRCGEVVQAGSAFWVVSDGDIVTSSDGVRWTRTNREAAGFEPDDQIDAIGGGGLGLLVTGIDHLGDPIDPVMWWMTGNHWERIDDHPALDPWGVEIVVEPTGLMIAIHRSFEAGAPVMWVYGAAG